MLKLTAHNLWIVPMVDTMDTQFRSLHAFAAWGMRHAQRVSVQPFERRLFLLFKSCIRADIFASLMLGGVERCICDIHRLLLKDFYLYKLFRNREVVDFRRTLYLWYKQTVADGLWTSAIVTPCIMTVLFNVCFVVLWEEIMHWLQHQTSSTNICDRQMHTM